MHLCQRSGCCGYRCSIIPHDELYSHHPHKSGGTKQRQVKQNPPFGGFCHCGAGSITAGHMVWSCPLMLSCDRSTSRAFFTAGSSFAIQITVPTGRFQIDYRHQKPRTAKRRSGVLRFYNFNLVSKCLAQMKLRFLLYLLYRLTANSPRYQTKYRCFLPRSGLSMSSAHHQAGLSMPNRS